MTVQRLERTRASFMDKVSTKDPSTQEGYANAINNFENYCMEKYGIADFIPELREFNEDSIFDLLQSWINWNNSRAPRTVTNYFSRLKKYLHYRGIKLHPQDIKEELDFKNRIDEELYPLSLDNVKTIVNAMHYKHKVQFICQLSGLMRIGETVQLRKKHLITNGENIIVKIPASIAKFKKGHTTFFSKEASTLLKPLLRKKQDNDLVFGSGENKRFSELNSEQILRRILNKVGLDMKYESNKRYMINTHSFRAYGITKLSRHDPNFAKKLAGQKGYLLQYDRMTDEEKLQKYIELEYELLVFDESKKNAEMERLRKENYSLNQIYEDEIKRTRQTVDYLVDEIEKLKRH